MRSMVGGARALAHGQLESGGRDVRAPGLHVSFYARPNLTFHRSLGPAAAGTLPPRPGRGGPCEAWWVGNRRGQKKNRSPLSKPKTARDLPCPSSLKGSVSRGTQRGAERRPCPCARSPAAWRSGRSGRNAGTTPSRSSAGLRPGLSRPGRKPPWTRSNRPGGRCSRAPPFGLPARHSSSARQPLRPREGGWN